MFSVKHHLVTKVLLFCTWQDPTIPMHPYKKIFFQEQGTKEHIFISSFFFILLELELEETIISTFDEFREGQLDHLNYELVIPAA